MNSLIKLLKPQRGKITLFCCLLFFSTALELALPVLMNEIVNSGIANKDFSLVLTFGLLMVAASVVSFVLSFFCARLSTRVTASFAKEARTELFLHTMDMSFSDLNRIGTGALITRSTQDIGLLQDFIGQVMNSVVTVPVLFVGGSILAFSKDPYIALIIAVIGPFILFLAFILGKKMMPLQKRANEYIDKQNTIVRERLSGIRVIRAYNAEEREHNRMKRATELMAENIIKANVAFGLLIPLAMLIINSAVIFILYLGSVRMEKGVVIGDVFALIQYIMLIVMAVMNSAWVLISFPRLKVAVGRINEVLKTQRINNGGEIFPLSGDIEIKNMSYKYPASSLNAIEDIDFSAKPGEKIALIGGTGSGKTTLITVLAGLVPSSGGEIFLGGAELSSLSVNCVSKNVATVFQRHDIFSGTVRENLDPMNVYTDDELFDALKTAQFDEYIKENGLDYKLNQGGNNLSGGQKQRLSIARALLKKEASVFIFDDSFSALDYLTEQRLRAALNEKLADKTVIICTQRAATARHCDRIYVFENGKITDGGKHAELMKSSAVYKEIYVTQTGGQL